MNIHRSNPINSPKCKKSDEVVTRPDGPYCLACGEKIVTSPHRDKAMPEENNSLPSQDVADGERSGERRLSNCSAVWVVVQRDDVDGDSYTMHPAYTTKKACLKRIKRLQDREEDSYSYDFRCIPVVGLSNV